MTTPPARGGDDFLVGRAATRGERPPGRGAGAGGEERPPAPVYSPPRTAAGKTYPGSIRKPQLLRTASGMIAACRPVSLDGTVVTLGFPEDQAFLKDALERRRATLEEGIGRIFSTPTKDDAKNQVLLQLRSCLLNNKL